VGQILALRVGATVLADHHGDADAARLAKYAGLALLGSARATKTPERAVGERVLRAVTSCRQAADLACSAAISAKTSSIGVGETSKTFAVNDASRMLGRSYR
jgi:hypothetical protein